MPYNGRAPLFYRDTSIDDDFHGYVPRRFLGHPSVDDHDF